MELQPLLAKRSAVKSAHAETYLLISLSTFAATVILTRLFLQLTGYPQLGNSQLHIAHALWGGLVLVVSALLPLMLVNRWAFSASAFLSGVGIGLFIDEVGKFITQKNDYFYPPAAPLIYSFFLLLLLLYLYVRRINRPDPRGELYRALSDLSELVDNNLDPHEMQILLSRLDTARQAELPQVAALAAAVQNYLKESDIPLTPHTPDIWDRFMAWLRLQGERLGRNRQRYLIALGMALMGLWMLATFALLLYVALSPGFTQEGLLKLFIAKAEIQRAASPFWFYLRLGLDLLISLMALYSTYLLTRGNEHRGLQLALLALMLSLTGVLLLSFYLDQFGALTKALYQFAVLLLVLAYRRWYMAV